MYSSRPVERSFDIQEVLAIFRRNAFGIFISLAIALEIAALLVLYLPKKYKAEAVLDIQSSYFRNPLVSNLVSETTDPSELRAQRAGLVQLALGSSFLDELGESYALFESRPESRLRTVEREELLERIEYFSLGPTSFRISAVASTSLLAKGLTSDILKQVTSTFVTARYEALQQAHSAIQSQVEFLASTLKNLGKVREADKLTTRLKELDVSIANLKQRFTDAHPNLVKLRTEAKGLRGRLGASAGEPSFFDINQDAQAFTHSHSEKPIQEIYHDLLTKLSHLNIVLTMEKQNGDDAPMYLRVLEEPREPTQAIFPDPKRFMLFGLVAGLIVGVLQTVFFELKRADRVLPGDVIDDLRIPNLGQLPSLPAKRELLRLENKLGSNALPAPVPKDSP